MVEYTPSAGSSYSFPKIEVVSRVTLVTAKWTVSVAILLEFFGIMPIVHFLESAGGSLCHHQASRCFDGANGPWAVCARCSGMYFGWMFPLVLEPILKLRLVHSQCLRIVTVLFICAVVSALLERYGVFAASNITRALLGIPLGLFPAVMFIFVIKRLKQASSNPLEA